MTVPASPLSPECVLCCSHKSLGCAVAPGRVRVTFGRTRPPCLCHTATVTVSQRSRGGAESTTVLWLIGRAREDCQRFYMKCFQRRITAQLSVACGERRKFKKQKSGSQTEKRRRKEGRGGGVSETKSGRKVKVMRGERRKKSGYRTEKAKKKICVGTFECLIFYCG